MGKVSCPMEWLGHLHASTRFDHAMCLNRSSVPSAIDFRNVSVLSVFDSAF